MRNVLFATVLASLTGLAIGTLGAAHANSANLAPLHASQSNPLIENVYWVRTYYYRTYVYRTCGWVPTIYGPVRVCN